ncbi:Crotonobetainyl-CoA:carnitine CoA-transferase CaiB [Variovorax sp. HW608]|uniref:CaiB/BaiF CoA transferase family protein n=1 Tax=Variovorax sp. HW608 TaxID=1034889 RepID=UPI00082015E9|nr:CaiB/BaiF CoA-transferase family protein [Variovorax sp. HW608]SCK43486.1 Crotonobetainyl-CoA:carnitine CoA-transferase CaiB [Variovorax sp. HW608]
MSANHTTRSDTLPLTGVRVLDLSRVLAGPLCTQYLGDMGAEVIKVETPGHGDDTRSWPEFKFAADGARASGHFLSCNRNKRSIALDLKSDAGRAVVHRLAQSADIAVESFAPGVAARLGVDAAQLRALNPRLVHCSISGFGSVGPMRHGKGYDLILQAFSGMLSLTGDPGSPPMRSPFSPVDQGTGMHALIGILAALLRRDRTGQGCSVEASLFDTSAAFLAYFLQNYWNSEREPAKAGVSHVSLCPYGVFDTADRPLILGIANDALWRRFCALAGLGDAVADPLYASNGARVAHRAQTEALVTQALRKHGRGHWLALLDDAGIPCTAVHSLAEMSAHPHTEASGMVLHYEHSHFGALKGVAQPLRFDGERLGQRQEPPRCGEHTVEVLREAGCSDDAISALLEQGVAAQAATG